MATKKPLVTGAEQSDLNNAITPPFAVIKMPNSQSVVERYNQGQAFGHQTYFGGRMEVIVENNEMCFTNSELLKDADKIQGPHLLKVIKQLQETIESQGKQIRLLFHENGQLKDKLSLTADNIKSMVNITNSLHTDQFNLKTTIFNAFGGILKQMETDHTEEFDIPLDGR
jgi:ABC-type phosphate transport system auxiliary subunit